MARVSTYLNFPPPEGMVTAELQEMFWGAYYGACIDKYSIQWMFNCTEKK
jgi:PhnB protein